MDIQALPAKTWVCFSGVRLPSVFVKLSSDSNTAVVESHWLEFRI